MIETLLPIPPDPQPEAANGGKAPGPSGDVAPASLRGGRARRWVPPAVVALALGWSYAPNLRSLVKTWWEDPNYSHGFLVIPVALVILSRRWAEAGRREFRPSWWGWIGLVAVLASRAYCYEHGYEWSETATLLPAIACLTLAAGGGPLLRVAWPAIAFLVFLLYLPRGINGILSQPLQRLATVGSCAVLKLTGLWVVPEGNVILVGSDRLEVAAACNGLSMLMCLAATVAAMTTLVPMETWKRIALLLSIVPVALVSNILRISATAWCYHLFGASAGGHFAHDAAGWLMMPMALVLVGLELVLLSWLITASEEQPIQRPDRLLRRRPA